MYIWHSAHLVLLKARLLAIAADFNSIHDKAVAQTAAKPKAPATAQAKAQATTKPKGTSDTQATTSPECTRCSLGFKCECSELLINLELSWFVTIRT